MEARRLQEDEGGDGDPGPSVAEEGSNIFNYVTLESIKNLDELIDFMKEILP